jgi:gluconate 2-dehydrogenase gamma chain
MDRRRYLKTLAVGTVGAGVLLQGCETPAPKEEVVLPNKTAIDRTPTELAHEQKLLNETFFDEREMKTIHVLVDLIIPRDETSGSATDAGVPAFIEFMVKDIPRYQIPIRGGLKWLDLQSLRRYNADFVSCTKDQQHLILDDIAYPENAKPEFQQGVAFFNTMRDLTACGFFTSKIGIEDLGYAGNKPTQWDGVPQDVLEKYKVSYDERLRDIYVRYDT